MSKPNNPYNSASGRRVGQPNAENQGVGKTIFWAAIVSIGTVVGTKLVERLIEGPRRRRFEEQMADVVGAFDEVNGRLRGLDARVEALELGSALGAAVKQLPGPKPRERVTGGEALARLLALPGGFEGD